MSGRACLWLCGCVGVRVCRCVFMRVGVKRQAGPANLLYQLRSQQTRARTDRCAAAKG